MKTFSKNLKIEKNRKKLENLLKEFEKMQFEQDPNISFASHLRSPYKEEVMKKHGITQEAIDSFDEALNKIEQRIIKLAIELNDIERILDFVGGITAVENYMDMGPKITSDPNFVEKYQAKQKAIAEEIIKKRPHLDDKRGNTNLGGFEALTETYKDYGINTAQKMHDALKYYFGGPVEISTPVLV